MDFYFDTFFKSKEKIETVIANHSMLSVTLGMRNPFSRQNKAFKLYFWSCREEL